MTNLKAGDWLKWDRGNNQGPAFALVQKIHKGLVQLAVDYRVVPLYHPLAGVERDIAQEVVQCVNVYEVLSFLLQSLARLDFFIHILAGSGQANEVKITIQTLLEDIITPDLVQRFHENDKRSSELWPSDSSLLKELNENR